MVLTAPYLIGGASLCVACGLLFYYLKVSKSNRNGDASTLSSRQASIQVLIPKSAAGAVIGRNGSVIKKLQDDTKTKIRFLDELTTANEKVLYIRGEAVGAQAAELFIRRIIAEQPIESFEEIYVPKSALGYIIGRGGETIRNISATSGCKIKIEPDKDRFDRSEGDKSKEKDEEEEENCNKSSLLNSKITITGSIDNIEKAKHIIAVKVEENNIRQKARLLSGPGWSRNSSRGGGGLVTATSMLEKITELDSVTASSSDVDVDNEVGVGPGDGDSSLTHPPVAQVVDWPQQDGEDDGDGLTQVYVSAIESPQRFWVQLVNVMAAHLEILQHEMTTFYSNLDSRQTDRVVFKPGDLIASPFSGDESLLLYRARVLEDNGQELMVKYVDFGDDDNIPKSDVYRLDDRHLVYPFQAIECRLSGVELADQLSPVMNTNSHDRSQMVESAVDFMMEKTYCAKWVVLNARLVDRITQGDNDQVIPLIELFDNSASTTPTTDGGSAAAAGPVNIADLLVKKGFMKYSASRPVASKRGLEAPASALQPSEQEPKGTPVLQQKGHDVICDDGGGDGGGSDTHRVANRSKQESQSMLLHNGYDDCESNESKCNTTNGDANKDQLELANISSASDAAPAITGRFISTTGAAAAADVDRSYTNNNHMGTTTTASAEMNRSRDEQPIDFSSVSEESSSTTTSTNTSYVAMTVTTTAEEDETDTGHPDATCASPSSCATTTHIATPSTSLESTEIDNEIKHLAAAKDHGISVTPSRNRYSMRREQEEEDVMAYVGGNSSFSDRRRGGDVPDTPPGDSSPFTKAHHSTPLASRRTTRNSGFQGDQRAMAAAVPVSDVTDISMSGSEYESAMSHIIFSPAAGGGGGGHGDDRTLSGSGLAVAAQDRESKIISAVLDSGESGGRRMDRVVVDESPAAHAHCYGNATFNARVDQKRSYVTPSFAAAAAEFDSSTSNSSFVSYSDPDRRSQGGTKSWYNQRNSTINSSTSAQSIDSYTAERTRRTRRSDPGGRGRRGIASSTASSSSSYSPSTIAASTVGPAIIPDPDPNLSSIETYSFSATDDDQTTQGVNLSNSITNVDRHTHISSSCTNQFSDPDQTGNSTSETYTAAADAVSDTTPSTSATTTGDEGNRSSQQQRRRRHQQRKKKKSGEEELDDTEKLLAAATAAIGSTSYTNNSSSSIGYTNDPSLAYSYSATSVSGLGPRSTAEGCQFTADDGDLYTSDDLGDTGTASDLDATNDWSSCSEAQTEAALEGDYYSMGSFTDIDINDMSPSAVAATGGEVVGNHGGGGAAGRRKNVKNSSMAVLNDSSLLNRATEPNNSNNSSGSCSGRSFHHLTDDSLISPAVPTTTMSSSTSSSTGSDLLTKLMSRELAAATADRDQSLTTAAAAIATSSPLPAVVTKSLINGTTTTTVMTPSNDRPLENNGEVDGGECDAQTQTPNSRTAAAARTRHQMNVTYSGRKIDY